MPPVQIIIVERTLPAIYYDYIRNKIGSFPVGYRILCVTHSLTVLHRSLRIGEALSGLHYMTDIDMRIGKTETVTTFAYKPLKHGQIILFGVGAIGLSLHPPNAGQARLLALVQQIVNGRFVNVIVKIIPVMTV